MATAKLPRGSREVREGQEGPGEEVRVVFAPNIPILFQLSIMPKSGIKHAGTVLRVEPCNACKKAGADCYEGPGNACSDCYNMNRGCRTEPTKEEVSRKV